jgi:hypothetical protein
MEIKLAVKPGLLLRGDIGPFLLAGVRCFEVMAQRIISHRATDSPATHIEWISL